MDELIELERVDLARVQLGEADANVLEQLAQLVLVVVAEQLCCGSPPRLLAGLRHRAMDATVPAMALPADAVAQVECYCEARVPADMRSQMRLEHSVRGNAITIVERRPPWREDFGPEWSSTKVAQLRDDGGLWTLYCAHSNGRWRRYDEAAPASDVAPLLAALDEDVTGIFWG